MLVGKGATTVLDHTLLPSRHHPSGAQAGVVGCTWGQFLGLTTSRLPEWASHPLFWKPIVGAWVEAVDSPPINSDKSRVKNHYIIEWTRR